MSSRHDAFVHSVNNFISLVLSYSSIISHNRYQWEHHKSQEEWEGTPLRHGRPNLVQEVHSLACFSTLYAIYAGASPVCAAFAGTYASSSAVCARSSAVFGRSSTVFPTVFEFFAVAGRSR